MYNTKFVCTYNSPEVFLDTDNITESEKDFIRNTIYRQELLNILEMNDYNEDKMNIAKHDLYNKIKDCKELTKCMRAVSKRFMIEDEEFGLMILFSYDYMYLTHICISEFIETGKITNESLQNLNNLIF